jgi:transcriptional regulator with XRE-family HTH domain
VSTSRVASLGEYLRDQRRAAELSLRELARETGVSNPYLSQVERGLRKPSAEVLNKIAGALQISAEHLFVQAGLLDEPPAAPETTESAINADPALTVRQRRALLDVYAAFVAQNVAGPGSSRSTTEAEAEATDADPSGADRGTAELTDLSTPVPVGTPT